MQWLDIQMKVALESPGDANRILLAVGEAVESTASGDRRRWFMTSEQVGAEVGKALEGVLRGYRGRGVPSSMSERSRRPQRSTQPDMTT